MYEEWKDQCRVQISRDDFTIISEQIRVFITFFWKMIGENRGEGGNFEFGMGLCMGFELCWNYVFDLRIVQRDF